MSISHEIIQEFADGKRDHINTLRIMFQRVTQKKSVSKQSSKKKDRSVLKKILNTSLLQIFEGYTNSAQRVSTKYHNTQKKKLKNASAQQGF